MTDTITADRRKNFWERTGVDVTAATTPAEALRMAGMDWTPRLLRDGQDLKDTMLVEDSGITSTRFPGRNLIVRSDNGHTLSQVGRNYEAVSNSQHFAPGAQVLIDGGAKMRAAGQSDYGRRAFMYFDFPEAQVAVGGVDLIDFGFLSYASHDGSTLNVTEIRGTRKVCTNGMTVSLKGIADRVAVRHVGNVKAHIEQANKALRDLRRYVVEFSAAANHMLSTRMTLTQFGEFIDGLWPEPEQGTTPAAKKARTTWQKRHDHLFDLFRFAETNNLHGGSNAWGAFNAITELLDWSAQTRGGDREASLAQRHADQTDRKMKDNVFRQLLAVG